MDIVAASRDPRLFGGVFGGESWNPWRVFLAALFGLPAPSGKGSRRERELYRQCTGRSRWPTEPPREAFVIVGRRGGKSHMAAMLALYAACFRKYELSPGERAVVMVIATDRAQSKVILNYIKGLLESIPMLAREVLRTQAESIELRNHVAIEVHSRSFRSLRGRTCCLAIAEEVSWWRSEESATPDVEVLNALRPSLATQPGSQLICISTPYARRGAMWRAYSDHYGRDGSSTLVWQAPSRTMNSGLPQSVVDAALAEDPAAARAEWLAEFREDIESYLSLDVIQACVQPYSERAYAAGTKYFAFVDPSGGRGDSFAMAIAHAKEGRRERDGAHVIVDKIVEIKPPFDPSEAVRRCAHTMHLFNIRTCWGDRYGGDFVTEAFRKEGIRYKPIPANKSELYVGLVPVITSKRVELLDDPRLVNQLVALERRTSLTGRDSIDHPRGLHDDLANVVAGIVDVVRREARRSRPVGFDPWSGGVPWWWPSDWPRGWYKPGEKRQ